MDYSLIWSGRLWSVSVPEEVRDDERLRWTYAQTFAATDGSHREAMKQVLGLQYPGLGYGPVQFTPVSFAAVLQDGAADASVFGTCGPSFPSNKGSQRPRPPFSRQGGKDAVSDTSARHTPAPRPATSNASRPHGQPTRGFGQHGRPQQSKPNATPHTGGWMGSSSTNDTAS